MSCGCTCGNGCSPGCGCLLKIVLPDNPVLAYDAENVNLIGIGVYNGQSSNTFQFRGVASANSSLIVTLDAGNNVILLTLDIDQIIDDLPQATTTQRGVGETATDAEAIGKASTTVFVTPSNFAAMGASSTFAGFIEIATNAEAAAGASALLAITPASLAFVLSTIGDTKTFADAAARAVAVPDFKGQFGTQLDTSTAYVADGVAAGDWVGLLTLGSITNEMVAATTLTPSGFTFTIFGNGSLVIDQTTFTIQNNTTNFTNGVVRFGSGGATVFDWAASTVLTIAGVTVPANSVLTTTALGVPTSALKTAFVSTFNVQTGYAVINPATIRTYDSTTVTLPQLAQALGTLIEDLKVAKLPAT